MTNHRSRLVVAAGLLATGLGSALLLVYELATSRQWRLLWITVAVILVLAGLTTYLAELLAVRVAAVRRDVRKLQHAVHRLARDDARTQPLPLLQVAAVPVAAPVFVGRATVPGANGAEVVNLPSPETVAAVRRLAARVTGDN